jgi:4-hydroxy-3-polyprenylbenzoate decarboxylase
MTKPKIIVGVSGASGVIYALRLLHHLAGKAEVFLIISKVGKSILSHELSLNLEKTDINDFLKKNYNTKNYLDFTLISENNFFASIASGSFKVDGMVVVPCSMKTLAGIAHGFSSNLIQRAADVQLKEKRPLLLVTRETPLNKIHIKNMLEATDAGATIMPASPGFYHENTDITKAVDFVVERILAHLEIENNLPTWKN